MIALGLDDLEAGMTLAKDVNNHMGVVELAEGTVLTSRIIDKLRYRNIIEIYVEDSALTRQKDFLAKYQHQLFITESIFQETAETGSVPIKSAEQFVKGSLQPMLRQSGTIDFLYQARGKNPYEYQHAMNVSILSGVLAKWLHYDENSTAEIMLAGLLHDIGKTKLPPELLAKNSSKRSARETTLYENHSKLGYELLKYNPNVSENVRLSILEHHEHTDCSGYPGRLLSDRIHPYAKIIAIMNKYDGITASSESSTQTPFAALDAITQKMFSTLDTKACIALIHNLKTSLIGSEVILSDNSKGMIAYYAQENYKAAPLISLYESDKVLDLNQRSDLKIIAYNPAKEANTALLA
jgi:putative nucleotidyltransferase with HDIG domain